MSELTNIKLSQKEVSCQWLTAADIMAIKNNEEPWLWQPFIRRVGIAVLAGASDCGKSTLARQLAIAIATRQNEFLGHAFHVKHGRVCYIATEDEQYGTKEVLGKVFTGLGIEPVDAVHFLFDSENAIKDVQEFLKENKVDALVFDTWSDGFRGNPNNWVDIRANLEPYQHLATQHGCAVILLHHNVKNSEKREPDKNKLNGSQAIEAKARSVLELRVGDNSSERLLTITKGNLVSHDLKQKSIVLEMDGDTLILTNTGRIKDIKGGGTSDRSKYDREIWLSRFKEHRREGMSIDATRQFLAEKFTEETVPKSTWYKNNLRETDGQSIAKETVGLTGISELLNNTNNKQ
ncbi:MAG: AAA family ATPase [Flavipsychrobacter sp.]|nr:AAA family ATPase [Flavipsychrobacter sp.]